jgi:hypothetical protein
MVAIKRNTQKAMRKEGFETHAQNGWKELLTAQ